MTDRKPIDFALDSSRRDQVTVVWEGLTMLDAIGKAFELPAWEYKCVQVIGVKRGEFHDNLVFQGSLDGIVWSDLHDRWTHDRLEVNDFMPLRDMAENPRYVRPLMISGEEKSKVTVTLFCRRSA